MAGKGGKLVSVILFRFALPITLLAAAIFRFSALSLAYLICLLITPLLPVPSGVSLKGSTGIFLKCLIPVSLLPTLGQIVFHVCLFALATDQNPYGSMFQACSSKESIIRQIGYQRLDNAGAGDIIRLAFPDVLVFIMSTITLAVCVKMNNQADSSENEHSGAPLLGPQKKRDITFLRLVLDLCQNLMLAAAGVIIPSVFSGVYFLLFLILLTLWGCYKTIGGRLGCLRVLLLVYTGAHIIVLYLYQFQFFQEALAPSDLIARILGLTGVIKTDCSSLDTLEFYDGTRWSVFVNPAILFILYWILAFNITLWRKAGIVINESTEKSGARKATGTERQVSHQPPRNQNETGSMVFSGSDFDGVEEEEDAGEDEGDTIPLKRLVDNEEPMGSRYGGTDTGHVSASIISDTGEKGHKRKPFMSVMHLIMRQSYVLSLIAMMVWSITYHSWLTFALLLAACLLWMLPHSRHWCLRASPIILLYAECLLIVQYIFGMNLDKELPKYAGTYSLDEIGLKRFTDPCLNLALQLFYTILIVLTLRQYLSEKFPDKASESSVGIHLADRTHRNSLLGKLIPREHHGESYDSKTIIYIGNFLWLLLCKYWIIFCTIMLAIIAVQDVVIYRIIYMFLFLIFVLIFQLNYRLWRALMALFWWAVVTYSMIVLTVIYTYQFQNFHQYWLDVTGFSNDTLKDIGLEQYSTAELFVKLLTPTIFVIILILQLRYFHTPFLKLSALDRFKSERTVEEVDAEAITEDEEDHTGGEERKPTLRNVMKRKLISAVQIWESATRFLWRFGEIHFFKLVYLIVIIVAVEEVSALTFVYMLLVGVLLPISRARHLLSHLSLFWTCCIILAKMIYQLRLVRTNYWMSECIPSPPLIMNASNTSVPWSIIDSSNTTQFDNAIWFGLVKIENDDISLSYYTRLYLLILVLIAFESVIGYHQTQHFNNPAYKKPMAGIIFPDIRRASADKSITECIQFFVNYLFYKFGLEICFIMTGITIAVRVDAISVIYAVMLGIIITMNRRTVAGVWPIYKWVLAIMLPVQFVLALGFPYVACIEYPWDNNSTFSGNLKQWLFLPDYVYPPHSYKLIADFLQLLFVCLQSSVFSIEKNADNMERYGGGDNADILKDVEEMRPIPVEDFTIEQRTNIDMVKYLVFESMFWVTMAIVFITGATRINFFSLFYVVAVFCFMWYGKEFFLKPLRKLLRKWNYLICYCVFVLFAKACLQLVGCVYVNTLIEEGQCWLVQLFGVNCLLSNIREIPDENAKCVVQKDDAGLAWDVVCLTFLLLQRRIYCSHYFRHVVDTMLAQNNLVSRGAELINRIMIREVIKQNEEEMKILTNIKTKMKALKKKQARLKKDFKEPEEHFQAIRAGDYYLFDDDDDDEFENPKDPTSLTFGTEKPTDGEQNPLQVINTAHDQGAETAIKTYGGESEDKDEEESEEEEPGKISLVVNFIITLWYSVIDWLIRLCHRLSRNYRLVAKKLSKELVLEKEKVLDYKREAYVSGNQARGSQSSEVRVNIEEPIAASAKDMPVNNQHSALSLDELEKEDCQQIEEEFKANKARFHRLASAVRLLLVSRSELLCYFLMILNMLFYGSLLSLPLPLMVFLWGMLSVPRPSKTFWITIITYTEAVVVCKYLFQFGFFPWNNNSPHDGPFFPPRIIGIEKVNNYANVDIALLLALFLHRSILRKYGLWRDAAHISADLQAANVKENVSDETVVDESTTFDPSSKDSQDSVNDGDEDLETLLGGGEISVQEENEEQPKSKLAQGLSYVINPFTTFFTEVTQSSYNATADVYAPMFFCDFILFLVLVFGFSSFGPAESAGGDVTSYISENKIPVPFLIMLLAQFVSIVIDRGLFLRKFVLGKFVFQIILVIIIHIFLFFILPATTNRSFSNNPAAQIWYFIKCIYFGLSAYQIRCGYPNRILGNFLTKNYGYINLFLFKGFMAIPFLLELRALMDWMWTDSTLAIGNWLQMEDVYANIFVLKCWREIEKQYPQERGLKKSVVIKYLVGGLLLVLIIFIIWFPLVFFSLFNTVFVSNPPYEASVSIGIGGYQSMFTTTAVGSSIRPLTEAEFSALKTFYSQNPKAYSFISGFEPADVTLTAFDGKGLAVWSISPVSKQELVADLKNSSRIGVLDLTFEVKFERQPSKGIASQLSKLYKVDLTQSKYKSVRDRLADIIENGRNDSVAIKDVFPRFLRLADMEVVQLDYLDEGPGGIGFSNISMKLQNVQTSEWWDVSESILGQSVFTFNSFSKAHLVDKVNIVTFNDKKAPSFLSFLSGYGVMGLYVTFILVIGRVLRVSTTNQSFTIMYRELPDVDYHLQLCLDVYLVREMKEFQLEEELYAKVIFLYRSPETTVKVTRQTVRIGNIKKKED